LERGGQIQKAGLTFSVSYHLLRPPGRNTDESMEDVVERVATNIQELINQEFSLRMVKNEQ
jgi:hypothetical protein